jgi:TPP-dependent trihydroxycyclohexane-1,2-dione (THcHDO) dehydratase
MMVNGFLQAQGFPTKAHIDMSRASDSISNLIDHAVKKHLNVKISSVEYVKPAVKYVKELLKIGRARELLQQLNATEMSDKLTDTLNLEASTSQRLMVF